MKQNQLGQHFLINKAAAAKIVAALDLKPNEIIIEIGPGKGALTIPLLKECQKIGCKVIGIEKDKKLAGKLSNSVIKQLSIVNDDALKILPKLITQLPIYPITNYKVVGNIPYYITGKLLRVLGDLITQLPNYPITNIVLMLQKEVAERIVAKPPRNNLLAAATQFWAEPQILFTLKQKDFNPPPKVESTVIKLVPNLVIPVFTRDYYYKLIHILFKQPRKTILNNFRNGLKMPLEKLKKQLLALKIDPAARPQNLSLNQIKALCDLREDKNQ